jgi:hypothetical protein
MMHLQGVLGGELFESNINRDRWRYSRDRFLRSSVGTAAKGLHSLCFCPGKVPLNAMMQSLKMVEVAMAK